MKNIKNGRIYGPGLYATYSSDTGQLRYMKRDIKGGSIYKHWYYSGKMTHIDFYSIHPAFFGQIQEGESIVVDKRDGEVF